MSDFHRFSLFPCDKSGWTRLITGGSRTSGVSRGWSHPRSGTTLRQGLPSSFLWVENGDDDLSMANYIVQFGSLMLSPTDGKTDLKDVESPFFIGLVIPTCADVPHVFFLFYSTSTMGSHQLLRIPIPDVPHGTGFLQIYANILPLPGTCWRSWGSHASCEETTTKQLQPLHRCIIGQIVGWHLQNPGQCAGSSHAHAIWRHPSMISLWSSFWRQTGALTRIMEVSPQRLYHVVSTTISFMAFLSVRPLDTAAFSVNTAISCIKTREEHNAAVRKGVGKACNISGCLSPKVGT